MKKIFFAAAIFCPALLTAQSFEGIMKFSWSYTGEQAAMLAQAMPSATTIYVKGTSTKVVSEGGMMSAMMGEVINIGSEKTTYFVMASEKSVYKVKSDEVKSKQDETATVTKESSTAIILGYKCQKYKVVTKNGTNYVWATKEIDMSGVDYKGKIGYKGVE